MEILGIASVAPITIMCYLLGAGLKAWDKFDDRKIPIIMGIAGAALGAVAFYVAPSLMATKTVFVAIPIGVVSGFAATGIHQIFKQMTRPSGDISEPAIGFDTNVSEEKEEEDK